MSSAYRTLNLRSEPPKENLHRHSKRLKSKAQMWDRLTANYLKRYQQQLAAMPAADKSRLQSILGDEISQFLDSAQLTEKSLRMLE